MTNLVSQIPHEENRSLGQIEEWLDGLHEIDEVRKNAIAQ
jgi:hypothetical protein